MIGLGSARQLKVLQITKIVLLIMANQNTQDDSTMNRTHTILAPTAHMYKDVHTHTPTPTPTSTHTHTSIHTHTYLPTPTPTPTYVPTHTHTHTPIPTHTHTPTHPPTHPHTHTQEITQQKNPFGAKMALRQSVVKHVHTYVGMCIHTCMLVCSTHSVHYAAVVLERRK